MLIVLFPQTCLLATSEALAAADIVLVHFDPKIYNYNHGIDEQTTLTMALMSRQLSPWH